MVPCNLDNRHGANLSETSFNLTVSGLNLMKGDFLAKYVHSGSHMGGKSAVVLAGTRHTVLRVASKCVQTASCEVLSAPEGQTHTKKRCNPADMRG